MFKKSMIALIMVSFLGIICNGEEQNKETDLSEVKQRNPGAFEIGIGLGFPARFYKEESMVGNDRTIVAKFDFNILDYYLYIANGISLCRGFDIGAEIGVGGKMGPYKTYTDYDYETTNYDGINMYFPMRVYVQFGEGNSFFRVFTGSDYSFDHRTVNPLVLYAGVKAALNGFYVEGAVPIDVYSGDALGCDSSFELKLMVGFLGLYNY